MDTVVTICALVAAIIIKGLLFLFYTKQAEKKGPKKKQIYEIVQKGRQTGAKRVLVTGGCGFLGSCIVRQLEERLGPKVDIVVLDTAVHTKFGPMLPDVTFISGDICTYTHVQMATAGVECVVHTAGLVGDCRTTESAFTAVNEQGTRNVVEACLERDVRVLVYTSSVSVLFSASAAKNSGGGGLLEPALETAKPLSAEDLNGGYARSKAAAERLVLAANSHVLHTIALRPGGVYGHNDPNLMTYIMAGRDFSGPGDVRVPFVWVEDAARGHVDAVEQLLFPRPDAPRIHGRAYHLCHDPVRDPFTYQEMLGGSPTAQSAFGPRHASVKAKEAAAGVQDPPPAGLNAYGRRLNKKLSYKLVRVLALVNYWVAQRLGIVLIDPAFTPQNMHYAANHCPCDVTDARELLGWEPTPWRVVAKKLGEEWAADKGKVKAA
ncbi:hypothetical protein GPECTOR_38g325 [Gonium pectorale]|uniref:3-beta hydroxysteroid dehydrogenase/isomerase domain-containing protein n=1 Tax=Gonium pectorale TaxID=33097 RepID=A0A150GB91_GONPE|nr:hypothetical protein GPECTOR_38g325 [Gonium pectorale]|eukprot:KXZ47088.1 hypothetical protein GPECTOR_38g325 [Gonium pectorale]